MLVINWLDLRPSPTDIMRLHDSIKTKLPLEEVCELLVLGILEQYPWEGRNDLIPTYDPTILFHNGQYVAFLQSDSGSRFLTGWDIARVKCTRLVTNPIQGEFQVATFLKTNKEEVNYAGNLPPSKCKSFLPPKFPTQQESLVALSNRLVEIYGKDLINIVKKLCYSGEIRGFCSEDTFFPECQVSLSLEDLNQSLNQIFESISSDKSWITTDEIISKIPALQNLPKDQASSLVNTFLQERSYVSLGGGRWTTQALYNLMNREIPHGLPVPHIRSRLEVGSEQDNINKKHSSSLNEIDDVESHNEKNKISNNNEKITRHWEPPAGPIKLPTLNYLHITHAYFPVGKVMHAFAPEIQLVFVQFIEGEYHPFLLDRNHCLLKAKNRNQFRQKFLEYGIPAGTFLWLEYCGKEKYRIVPHPLSEAQMVECKLAYMKDGELIIEHTQIPMYYEGDPFVFKANLRFEDIDALFAEAHQVNLSIRDAIIDAIRKLCEADPFQRAHYKDIFNYVFLKRMCSTASIRQILYSNPCFEQLGEGYFRYNPNLVSKKLKHISLQSPKKSRITSIGLSDGKKALDIVKKTNSEDMVAETAETETGSDLPQSFNNQTECTRICKPQIAEDSQQPVEHGLGELLIQPMNNESTMVVLSEHKSEFFEQEPSAHKPLSHKLNFSVSKEPPAEQSSLELEFLKTPEETSTCDSDSSEQINSESEAPFIEQSSFEYQTSNQEGHQSQHNKPEILALEHNLIEEIIATKNTSPLEVDNEKSTSSEQVNDISGIVRKEFNTIQFRSEALASAHQTIIESLSPKAQLPDFESSSLSTPSGKEKKRPVWLIIWLVLKRWFRDRLGGHHGQ